MKIWSLFLFFSICFLCFSIVGSCLSSAATVFIDTDGTGNYNCDGTNDHIEINQALTYIDGLGGGTVYLRGPNTYWIDATLEMGSNTVLTGDSSACIKLVPNAGWGADIPLIRNKSGDYNDFTIMGFEIDGNSENQLVVLGQGYYTLMYFENCKRVTVKDMRLEWGTGDGLKVRNKPYSYTSSADVKFTNNSVYKLGHDVLYVLGMNGVIAANNDVYTRTNSAFRLSSSGGAKIYNNIVHSQLSNITTGPESNISGPFSNSTGPGIEIDKDSGFKSENIEIFNNIFHTLNGAAIWIDGEDKDNVIRGKDVYIHHNIMYNVGQYYRFSEFGYSNAAITIGQFNNTRIENNVIDNGGLAGIKYYQYNNSYKMSAKFTTYVNNNVIMNCAKDVATGVWNYNSMYHKFILNNNCIYNNTNGTYTGSNIIHNEDIYVDPLFVSSATRDYHLKSYAGHYSNGICVFDTVTSSLIDAGYPKSAYSSEPYPNGGRVNIGRYGNTVEASKSISSAPPQSIVSYAPLYDNRLRSDTPTSVLSTTTYLDIGRSTPISRDIMVFDLSSYKTTDTISKATLSLYWYYPAGKTRTSDTVVEIYRPLDWDARYVTWNSRLSGTLWSTAGGNWVDKNGVAQGTTPYSSLTFAGSKVPDNKYYDFDVTQLVQDYVSGKYKNTGFFLKAKTESGNYIAFYSSEWTNAAQRPKLTVTAGASAVDNPPVANAGADKTGTVGSPISFDGSASTDDIGIASYSWDFNIADGITTQSTSLNPTYTYTTAGTRTVILTVTDAAGQKSTDTLQVTVNPVSVDNPPVANAGADQTATVGSAVTFDASLSTDDTGIASYSWDFDASNGITADATTKTASRTYTTAGTYTVTLTVTDTIGQKSNDTLQVVVSSATTPISTASYAPLCDNRLKESSSTTVLSTSNFIDIGGLGTSSYRDLMLFNLSSYKTTDTISKATLSLYWYYPAGKTRTSDTVVEIYRPLDWDPQYVTWNSRQSGTLWSTAGGNWFDKNGVAQGTTPYASLTFAGSKVPDNKYYDFDVTQLVREYVSGKYNNTGFFLKAKTESGNYIAFYSSEWTTTAQRPKLTITR